MRTVSISELSFIEKKDFLELMKKYPLDNENFHMIKDSILLYKRTENLR